MIVNCELKDPTTALRCALSNRRNEDNIFVRYFNDNVLSDITTFPFDLQSTVPRNLARLQFTIYSQNSVPFLNLL
jgi:hypothetical protein